jgi:hypothetical protein
LQKKEWKKEKKSKEKDGWREGGREGGSWPTFNPFLSCIIQDTISCTQVWALSALKTLLYEIFLAYNTCVKGGRVQGRALNWQNSSHN